MRRQGAAVVTQHFHVVQSVDAPVHRQASERARYGSAVRIRALRQEGVHGGHDVRRADARRI